MRLHLRLRTTVLLLGFANLLALLVAGYLFFRLQFQAELNSLLLSPSREKILAITTLIGRDLRESRPEERDAVLARHAAVHQVNFVFVDNDGNRLAGPTVEIPREVLQFVREGPPGQGPPVQGPPGFPPPPKGPRKKGPPGAGALFLAHTEGPYPYWVGVRMPANFSPGEAPLRATMLLYTPTFYTNAFFFDYRPFAIAAAIAIGLSLFIWLPFIGTLTGTLQRMSAATEAIANGNFQTRIPPSSSTELHHLGESINRMSKQLDTFVEGQRRFLGDVSHELCSPIARIQFALGILENEATGTQQQHIDDLHEEVQHMSALVNELMSFSKASLRTREVKLEPVDLLAVVERALAREVPPGRQFLLRVPDGLFVLAEPDLLFRAIANVLRNAYRYAGDAAIVEVEALTDSPHAPVRLRILDNGPGLAPEHLERVFEAFYRPESARTRSGGGFGLGLAIVKAAMDSCRGTVHCENREPHGLILELRLNRAL